MSPSPGRLRFASAADLSPRGRGRALHPYVVARSFQGRVTKKEAPASSAPFLHQLAGNRLALEQNRRRLACRNQAAWLPDHDQHHGEAEDQHAVLVWVEVA